MTNESNREVAHLVCIRLNRMIGAPAPGSTPDICGLCAEPVWTSPASRAAVPPEFTLQIICIECATKTAAASDEATTVHTLTEDQREEIALATGALDNEIDEDTEHLAYRILRR